MKILLLGAGGFIGRRVKEALDTNHEVYQSTLDTATIDMTVHINLLKVSTIEDALKRTHPEVIINCAGVVDNSEKAAQNPIFTENLLRVAVNSKLEFNKIIISGSAAEYGVVGKNNISVNEDTPLKANSGYGLSKLKETTLALDFAKRYNLPVVIARIFNPIGVGMHHRFLIPRILQQINEIQSGMKDVVEVSRLDSKRDYVDVSDVASAIKSIVENKPKESAYNIGSGKSTSNGELVELILKNINLPQSPKIVETSNDPEPLVASQADIGRIKREFGWKPLITVEETIQEIMHDSR